MIKKLVEKFATKFLKILLTIILRNFRSKFPGLIGNGFLLSYSFEDLTFADSIRKDSNKKAAKNLHIMILIRGS
ncbi:MAG TPA: hypothetical protein VIH86_06340 [Puia sp.]